jgi:hypothetical protein
VWKYYKASIQGSKADPFDTNRPGLSVPARQTKRGTLAIAFLVPPFAFLLSVSTEKNLYRELKGSLTENLGLND